MKNLERLKWVKARGFKTYLEVVRNIKTVMVKNNNIKRLFFRFLG